MDYHEFHGSWSWFDGLYVWQLWLWSRNIYIYMIDVNIYFGVLYVLWFSALLYIYMELWNCILISTLLIWLSYEWIHCVEWIYFLLVIPSAHLAIGFELLCYAVLGPIILYFRVSLLGHMPLRHKLIIWSFRFYHLMLECDV